MEILFMSIQGNIQKNNLLDKTYATNRYIIFLNWIKKKLTKTFLKCSLYSLNLPFHIASTTKPCLVC